EADDGSRIHFLDWRATADQGQAGQAGQPQKEEPHPVLLIHGLAQTAWIWGPVARRLTAGRASVPAVAMDLRGHGLSDAPTGGYDPDTLAGDAIAVAEGSGLLDQGAVAGDRVVIAGHGFGAIVAAWTAAALGTRCAGLLLVDGGWEDLAA